jgi:membrane protease YdiL (CAAX protease family)
MIFTRRMTSRPPPTPAAERRWTIRDCLLILALCLAFQFLIAPILPGFIRLLPLVAGHRVAALLVLYLSLFAIPLALILPVYTRWKFGRSLKDSFLRSATPGRDLLTGLVWFTAYLIVLVAAGWVIYTLRPAGLPLETMAALEKVNPRMAAFFRSVLGLLHGLGPGSALLFFIVVGIAVPLLEEMYFRGCILNALQDRWGPRAALGVSALAFGALHLNLLLFPLYFVLGILTGMLYQKRGSLLAPVVFHSLNNLVSLAVIVSVV